MKVLFVKASSVSHLRPSVGPPLGVMYLASCLREVGVKVRIFDERVEGGLKGLLDEIEEFDPDICGISALTTEAENMHKTAKLIKEKKKSCVVICGGPHPTAYKQKCMEDKNIDFLGIYECEETIKDFVEALKGKIPISSVEGIVLRRNGKAEFKIRPPTKDLDSIPYPAWDLVPLDSYKGMRSQSFITIGRRYMILLTSRGCPYKCAFCYDFFGKRFRAHSPQRVFSEIKILYEKYNVKDFEIADDVFNLDENRAIKICDLIEDSKLKVNLYFSSGLRIDIISDKLISKLKSAGAKYIAFGIETASERIQKMIKKDMNLKRVERAIELMDRLKIFTCGIFILGFPTETEEEIQKTIRFALRSKMTSAMFFIPNPIEGTGLHEMSKEKLKISSFDDFGFLITPINISELPSKKLFKIHKMAYIRFYLNPKRIFKIIKLCPGRRIFILRDIILLLMVLFKRRRLKRE